MIVISDVITNLNDDPASSIEKAKKVLGIPEADISDCFVLKTSIDARHRKQPQLVSSVGFITKKDEKKLVSRLNNPKISYRNVSSSLPKAHCGKEKLNSRPVVVGFGPAGMFAGLVLARYGYRPLIIERGADVETRVKDVSSFWQTAKLNVQSNVQFGEGGAGTFSDGKLTTRINDPLCDFVLSEFVRFGAPDEILKKAKPHIGTDYLREVVKAIKNEIISLGGEVLNHSRLTDISIKNGKIDKIFVNDSPIPCSELILAIGHSARDTFKMLYDKDILMQTKPFSIGVRIEHLQDDINLGLYGKYAGHPLLSKGEYQLSLRKNDRAVYTFCMCPGGTVVPSSSEADTVVTNGMSIFARDGKNANSALVVSVSQKDFGDDPMDAINFQRKYEKAAFTAGGSNYCAPAQNVGAFLNQKRELKIGRVEPTYSLGVKECDFNAIFPSEISDMMRCGLTDFGRKIRGFDANDAILTGIETRTSSPVRILRGENMQSVSTGGLYPCGEGAGYAGGIMSAAVDGIKVALALIEKYKPL